MASTPSYDVALVGFGPTGATLAALLGQAGHRVLVIERDRDVYQLPRAVHFDCEVMRIFQGMGLSETVLPFTRIPDRCEFWTADRRILLAISMAAENDQGWASDYMFHQPSLEQALREAALACESVEVRYGAVDDVVSHGDASRLTFTGESGAARDVEARWLVGCDGAASTVRRCAGMGLEDLGFDEPWMVVDLRGTQGLPEFAVQHCDPARPTTLVPGALGFYRFEFMLRPEEQEEDVRRPEHLRRLLAAWVDPDAVEVVRSAVYRFHAIVARDWLAGRVAVAGDAAHQTPPFLGQGMCAGIRDAANLGWKLDCVLRGQAGEGLLETYGSERAPHVREFIQRAVAIGRVICTQDPVLAAERDQQMLEQRERGEAPDLSLPTAGPGCFQDTAHAKVGRLAPQYRVRADGVEGRMDDLTGGGFRLILREADVDPAAFAPLRALGGQVAVWSDTDGEAPQGGARMIDLEGHAKAFFENHRIHAFLTRPDNLTFGVAERPDDVAGLVRELERRLSAPPSQGRPGR
jgi:3-(3-hydroxy-phenyl)propionate hydroxylase